MDWTTLNVMITGGTGSFGRKCTEIMLAEFRPKKLIIFSRDELKQQDMRQIYDDTAPNALVRYFIGDIRDLERLRRGMHGVDVVIHAAALKQVPACEYNPFEAIQTNIVGTKNVIDAAIDCGVKKVVLVGTDKAVSPVNLYGATKLCAEKIVVQGNAYAGASNTRLGCVRYGNVVGSRGSVVPLLLKQRVNGPITITDPRMTRFWITLDQGVRFVIRCVQMMQGGEILVPKIPSMRLMDLASALAPRSDVKFIGIRAGEKLHEVLISEDEGRHTLEFDDMFVVEPNHAWWGGEHRKGGKVLPEGYRYASDTNPWQLTTAELLRIVAESGLPVPA